MILRASSGVSYQVEPMSFFERNGRVYFDLQHVSDRAALFMIETDPWNWQLIAG